MKQDGMEIHRNGMDIVQRLMAQKMVGQVPLKALSYESSKVKEVLPTEILNVSTKDDQADTLYLLEDDTFLHVEYQTTVKKHDSFRFAGYVMGLYNKYKDDKRISKFTFNTVVIYAPHIRRGTVNSLFDIGAIQYRFTPIFLNEVHQQKSYIEIIDKIRLNPNVELTEEEKMIILYRPLFNKNKEDIERDTILVVKDIQEMADELEKAKLTGTLFVLVKKYLSDSGQKRIWEVLKEMDIIKEEMEGIIKKNLEELLILALKSGDFQTAIKQLVKEGKLNQAEVEEIYRKAEEN
ncbi:hypothetical protein PP175_25560 (plasmid) [Aneurinibacillus sp. Ricciae_BoGa-3]|uniref:hypothetical protein n=1 Tax=Aneurinibacillus sp. Ricciae_BoGa-3 TaxID=3022697 RepID=UPI0023418876|nr:hypothetical protein [Aneurinibacillus sp. Ricciae_BoGa-3]WCK57437.1 hypothetical protein PP175_25560 [Aneurinibacillus sp. Ricciae_BoGa-3]